MAGGPRQRPDRPLSRAAVAVLCGVALLSGCTTTATTTSGSAGTTAGARPATTQHKAKKHAKTRAVRRRTGHRTVRRAGPAWTIAQARRALPGLRVHWYLSMARYSRTRFGEAWADVNRNGCDTRNDILNRDLVHKTWKYADRCEVATGILHDPYTGRTIHFRRGVGSSLAVQIDHMVALGDAWQTGARSWSRARREAFANDPRELIAVSGPANEQKGDDDASQWLPPRRAFDCQYVADQVMIKRTYGLWVTPPEKAAMARVLAGCP